MHQNAGFCIINIIFPEIRDPELLRREGRPPTTPTPVLLRPKLVPRRLFQAGYGPAQCLKSLGVGLIISFLSHHHVFC